jgi:hypothetical protein
MLCLQNLIGVESSLTDVALAIRDLARSFDVPVAGAYHVTCSDETEWECAEVFQTVLAESLLPPLKPSRRVAFHTMNLGARYETGAVAVAEHHYATPEAAETTKLMVVKINSHVAVRDTPDGVESGTLIRYGANSGCCGALEALLAGKILPAVDELKKTFSHDGINRVATLLDDRLIPKSHRALFAAVTNARLQAARAVEDITAHTPASPTVYLVAPCVTINRPGDDTELVVGHYGIDATEPEVEIRYRGLGDMPSEYRLTQRDEGVLLEDDQWPSKE